MLAALYFEAVLPAIPLLAAHDTVLAAALAGPAFAVSFSAPGALRTRLALCDGSATATFGAAAISRSGDIRLLFPTHSQVVRAFDGRRRLSLAIPLGGWFHLARFRRLNAAGHRLEAILNTRPAPHDASLALHAWGNLAVGIASAACWLRHAPDAPATRARLGGGAVVFSCPALPAPLWIDLDSLATGSGTPPSDSVLMATIHFADLDTVLAELDHRLDAPAAIGLGTLRVTGHIPLAENLGQLMLRVGKLLQPSRG